MKTFKNILCIIFSLLSITLYANENDSTITIIKPQFKGQLSTWGHFNPKNSLPLYLGARYIPQLNLEFPFKKNENKNRMLDLEVSANIYDNLGIHFFDSINNNENIKPYRAWARYSSKQFELRAGLQKINFGSANMLRALRWFDQVDPRDPLQLTDGVWALLGRYYFLNNANLWLWGLYGNTETKGFEFLKTNKSVPEFGGRLQYPIPFGEAAISYNYREIDSRELTTILPPNSKLKENKIGIDAKLDFVVGMWLEAVWINKNEDLGQLSNQEIFTLGTDYTFGIGNGINATLEHMLFSSNEKAFEFTNNTNFTALSIGYPIGMFDNLNLIFYYDWKNNSVYNFINWYRQFDKYTLYIMAYLNPENNQLPAMNTSQENLYGGFGIQIMVVWNH